MPDFKSHYLMARPQDVLDVLGERAKNFTTQFEETSDRAFATRDPNDLSSFAPVYAVVLIGEQPDPLSEQAHRFLSLESVSNKKDFMDLTMNPIGWLVPDITVQDLSTGLNSDTPIEEGVVASIDTLQLIRAVIEAGNFYLKRKIGVRVLDKVLSFSDARINFTNAKETMDKNGWIRLYLSCKLSRSDLDKLVQDLNSDQSLLLDANFVLKELDKTDYVVPPSVTIN